MVALTAAQLDEIWAAEESVACGALARLSEQTNYEADLRQSIHVDFLYQTLCFCREAGMSHTKALVIFEVMVETRAKAAGARVRARTRWRAHTTASRVAPRLTPPLRRPLRARALRTRAQSSS